MTTARPTPVDARDDAELARTAALGDQAAFAAIYDRFADRLHDFCVGMLRDREAAADCVQDVFVTAATRLAQLREPERLRSWLYAIARNEALGRIRERRREPPTEQLPETPSGDPDAATLAARGELADLISEASGGLSDRDRAVLELAYRRGLDGPELAEALGVSHSNANNLVGRMRENIERSLGALLVSRRAAADPDRCAELAALLEHWDGQFTVLMRKRIARHIDSCAACEDERRRMVNPVALLGSVPVFVPAPAWLREQTLTQVAGIIGHPAAPPAAPGAHADPQHGGAAGVGSPLGARGGLSWWPPRDIDTTDLGDAAPVVPAHPSTALNAGTAPNPPLSPQPGGPSVPEPFAPPPPAGPPSTPPDPSATGLGPPPGPGPNQGSAQVPHGALAPQAPVPSLPTDSAPGQLGGHLRVVLLVVLLLIGLGAGLVLGAPIVHRVWPTIAPAGSTAPAPSTTAPGGSTPTSQPPLATPPSTTASGAHTPSTTAPAGPAPAGQTTPSTAPPPPPTTTVRVPTTEPGGATPSGQTPRAVPSALPPKANAPAVQTPKTTQPAPTASVPPAPPAPSIPGHGHLPSSNGSTCQPGTTC